MSARAPIPVPDQTFDTAEWRKNCQDARELLASHGHHVPGEGHTQEAHDERGETGTTTFRCDEDNWRDILLFTILSTVYRGGVTKKITRRTTGA